MSSHLWGIDPFFISVQQGPIPTTSAMEFLLAIPLTVITYPDG